MLKVKEHMYLKDKSSLILSQFHVASLFMCGAVGQLHTACMTCDQRGTSVTNCASADFTSMNVCANIIFRMTAFVAPFLKQLGTPLQL